MQSFTLQSNAKINLGLRILGKREDGYHDLDTVFQEIDFGETLTFRRLTIPEFVLNVSDPELPTDERNLCTQAYNRLREIFPQVEGLEISLEKQIQVGAGLGGGSSNAATALLGIIRMFGLPVEQEQLRQIATGLGADVPFFLHGGTAHATGIGDKIESIPPITDMAIVLVVPEFAVSTAWAYENVTPNLTTTEGSFNFKGFFDIAELRRLLRNDFEPLVESKYAEIGEIKNQLIHLRADLVGLSGSGSAIFGLYSDLAAAREAVASLSRNYFCRLTSPVERRAPRMNQATGV